MQSKLCNTSRYELHIQSRTAVGSYRSFMDPSQAVISFNSPWSLVHSFSHIIECYCYFYGAFYRFLHNLLLKKYTLLCTIYRSYIISKLLYISIDNYRLLTYLHTYLLTYILTYLLHGAKSFLRSYPVFS